MIWPNLDGKHAFYPLLIGIAYQGRYHQSGLCLLALVSHHMRSKGLISFDLARTSHLKSLLGTGMRFHLRHIDTKFSSNRLLEETGGKGIKIE